MPIPIVDRAAPLKVVGPIFQSPVEAPWNLSKPYDIKKEHVHFLRPFGENQGTLWDFAKTVQNASSPVKFRPYIALLHLKSLGLRKSHRKPMNKFITPIRRQEAAQIHVLPFSPRGLRESSRRGGLPTCRLGFLKPSTHSLFWVPKATQQGILSKTVHVCYDCAIRTPTPLKKEA